MKLSGWLTLAALITSTLLLWNLRSVLIIIFAGIVLSIALCTLIGKVQLTLQLPRAISFLLVVTSGLLIFALSMVIVIPQFTEEFQQLIIQLPSAAKELWQISVDSIGKVSEFVYGENAKDILKDSFLSKDFTALPDGASLANGITDSLKRILNLAGNLGLGIVQFIFVISISLMIAIQPEAYKEVFILLIPSFYRRRARTILVKCGNSLSNWMLAVIISSSFVAILAGVSLYILGVKLVVANALLAGILNIIPNIGPTLSTIFPMSVALLDNPWKSLAVLGIYIIIQNLESYVITPSVMQHQVKLLPGFTLTAQFIFTIIFGPIGLLLSLPLAVIIQILVKEVLITDILDKRKALCKYN
ncbi:AI-2E family transporter [Prochlorococcus marinus]|uniref:Predicted permease n=1 Tax=Prochlorococcus marinus (strain MIT 9211) TaxID=93059 RepID=A9B9Y8_PROM4|nr:AI-2E family transporter [Prochlorococcus marinus]ABX08650.1 Predicted permease [Prochlorococcus marinus str. MIT 9211]